MPPLDSDDAYDVMDDIQDKANDGKQAANFIRYYLDKGADYAYGALGAWDFLITKGPVDWRKDLAKVQSAVRLTAQSLLEDTEWLERWAIVGVETKHDAGKAWIQVNIGEINSGKAGDEIISVSIDPGTGRLDVKS